MPRLTRPKIRLQDSTSVNLKQGFINNFNQKKDATLIFLPKLLNFITWFAVQQFQSYLAKITFNIKHVCTFCNFFIFMTKIT